MRGNGTPAVGYRLARPPFDDTLWVGKLIIQAYKRLTVSIKALNGRIGEGVVGIVIAAFLVFCFMIDGIPLYFHFAC